MAKKIKFGLEMADGYSVRRDLEELREHFDPVKAIEHFASGKLSEWLSDRYYDDIAEQLDGLDKDAPGFQRQLCKVLGVEASVFDDEELDVERIARTKEKETRLRQKTSDETIIANAAITAFDRSDLVELWDDGAETIYLCGDAFDIPASVGDTKYIGVLGTPKVTIKAKSPEDLADKGISFENVELSCAGENRGRAIPIDQLKEVFTSIFSSSTFKKNNIWDVVSPTGSSLNHYCEECNETKKTILLNLICKGKYKEDDLIYVRISEGLKYGWAFTKDSFCWYGGPMGDGMIYYRDLDTITDDNKELTILCKNGNENKVIEADGAGYIVLAGYSGSDLTNMKSYLTVVKNLYASMQG